MVAGPSVGGRSHQEREGGTGWGHGAVPLPHRAPGLWGHHQRGLGAPERAAPARPLFSHPTAPGQGDKGHGDPLPIWGLGAAPSGLSIPLQPPPPRGPPLCGPPPFVPGRARGLEAREGGTHTGEEPAKIWGRAHLSLPAEPDVRGRCAALRGGSARGRHTKAAAPLRAPGECGPHGVPRPPRSHPHAPGGGRREVMG